MRTNDTGTLIILSAPSGAGKTTLVNALVNTVPELAVSVSHTTRPARPGETEGVSYYFTNEESFSRMAKAGAFLEYARVFDHHYGTAKDFVASQLAAGCDVLLEIDWQGARQIRQARPDSISIFLLPPSYRVLWQRLEHRGESPATIRRRMEDAATELSHYREYDYLVINHKLELAVEEISCIIRASRCRYGSHQEFFDRTTRRLLEEASDIQ